MLKSITQNQEPSAAAEAALSQISNAFSPWKMSYRASCLIRGPVLASMMAKVGSSATLNLDLSLAKPTVIEFMEHTYVSYRILKVHNTLM